jgi:hypothetical protein
MKRKFFLHLPNIKELAAVVVEAEAMAKISPSFIDI